MSDVTRILSAIDQGDPHAAGQLLPAPSSKPNLTPFLLSLYSLPTRKDRCDPTPSVSPGAARDGGAP
jgi:hypothetical protein